MKKFLTTKSSVVAAGMLLSSLAWANDSALNDFLARLDQLQNLQTEFTQTTRDARGNSLQKLEGQMIVAKPGKMRWQTKPPYEQLVISDGQSVWIYDVDLEQVTIRPMEQRIAETPALLLSGDTKEISKNFTLEESKNGSIIRFSLFPKDKSQLFEKIEFQYAENSLESMRILDAAGQATDIFFNDVSENQKLDDQLFKFTVPEGVDVIDGRNAH
ncbi:MAG: outer membrane lipoprotein chaperone LolA [Venatoribacter sp.]